MYFFVCFLVVADMKNFGQLSLEFRSAKVKEVVDNMSAPEQLDIEP